MALHRMQKLKLDEVRIDGGTQPRDKINQETVAEYAQLWKDKVSFPGLVAYWDGVEYWLADGFHRYLGAQDAGLKEVIFQVYDGSQRAAILFSVGANQDHGLRRTNADKRKAIRTLLEDSEWAKWSDNKIAQACGVSDNLVATVRSVVNLDEFEEKSTENKDLSSASTRSGRCAEEKQAPVTERKAIRNGKEYTVNTEKIGKKTPPAKDSGRDSAPAAATPGDPAWKTGQKELDRLKRDLEVRWYTEITAVAEGPGGHYLTQDKLKELHGKMDNMLYVLIGVRPYNVCPYCKTGKSDCKFCRGCGYVTRSTWDNASPKLQEAATK